MDQSKNHYLAITTGPIIKTLMEARKTRELWAASYVLSSLMEQIIKQLDPNGQYTIMPRIAADTFTKPRYGAGIYPDRCFMSADHFFEDKGITSLSADKQAAAVDQQIATAVDAALQAIAKNCLLAKEAADPKFLAEATDFWKQFFRVRWVVQPLENINNGQLSSALSPLLENLELEDTCFPEEPNTHFLYHFFEPNRFFNSDLVEPLKTGKGNYAPIMHGESVFPSTSDIAAYELFRQFPDEMGKLDWDDKNEKHELFYQAIEKHDSEGFRKSLLPLHKYFCIVQADGDGIGAAIKQLSNTQDYIDFSESLACYGTAAAADINTHGGKPIYIGGDDLLFLCPVRTDEGNVFDLIDTLDKRFQELVQFKVPVSLSYGINIVYYKYPLFEAIGDAYGIMMQAKKHETASGGKKNSISFQFTKHSGSAFQSVFSKTFLHDLLKEINVFSPKGSRNKAMVSSLVFKLQTLKKLLSGLILDVQDTNQLDERVEATLKHFFNEWKNTSWFDEQRKAIQAILKACIAEYGTAHTNDGELKAMELFYNTMRLVQFMTDSKQNTLQHDTENIAQAAG